MDFWQIFLNGGGALIGVIGLILTLILYRASRIGPRPVFQCRALRIIEKDEKALRDKLEILFEGKSIPRLTETYIIFWNSGKAILDGEGIASDDPLRLKFSENAEVLRVRVLKVTRTANKFIAEINSSSQNEVIYSFDYLDPGDGATIEILHTAQERYPKVQGTIRGVPKGVLDWGLIPPYRSSALKKEIFSSIFPLFFGIFLIVSGPSFFPPLVKWVMVGLGIFLVLSSSLLLLGNLLFGRRRFPKVLATEDIEGLAAINIEK